jgi:hypothetical protein
MKKLYLSLALLVLSTSVWAGNDNANPCGNNGNNCNPGSNNGGAAYAVGGNATSTATSTATGTGIGTGVGIGIGGAGGLGGNGGAGGNGGSVGNVSASGGNINNEAADYGDLRIVPPAIAPSVNTAIICPMVMQGSKAASVFFASISGTHEPDLIPICVAWHLGQKSVVEKMACNSSKEYRDANPACGPAKTTAHSTQSDAANAFH